MKLKTIEIILKKCRMHATTVNTSNNYAFNGQEKDDEIKGANNSYSTEYRFYDPRLGRWLSIDTRKTYCQSPYVGMNNSPIKFYDQKGDTVGYTDAFSESQAGNVYFALRSGNSVFNSILSSFDNANHNITFDYDAASTRGASGETSTTSHTSFWTGTRSSSNEVAIFGSKYKPKKTGYVTATVKPADIFIAKTLIHEGLHAYINAKGIDVGTDGTDPEHEYIATHYRVLIVQGLKEFAKENYVTGLVDADYEAVSWAGLEGTNAFKSLPQATQDDYNARNLKLSAQLTFSTDSGGSAPASQPGNMPSQETKTAASHVPQN
ncbi:MAG: hypothetical protein A2W11_02800 [Ignavibacteria bacterium RBG_16_35_7]|nr:MAG: hypothetical protein A2W11_02800 [Ignavibacteria bacterium RBG_16_35_7]